MNTSHNFDKIGLPKGALSNHVPVFGKAKVNNEEINIGTWSLLKRQKNNDTNINPANVKEDGNEYTTQRQEAQQDYIIQQCKEKKLDFFALQEVQSIDISTLTEKLKKEGFYIVKFNDTPIIYNATKYKHPSSTQYANEYCISTFERKDTKNTINFGSMYLGYDYNTVLNDLFNTRSPNVILAGNTNNTNNSFGNGIKAFRPPYATTINPDNKITDYRNNGLTNYDAFFTNGPTITLDEEKCERFEMDGDKVVYIKDEQRNENIICLNEHDTITNLAHGKVNKVTDMNNRVTTYHLWLNKDNITNNNKDTVYLFGSNDGHYSNRGAGGANQAKETQGQQNLFPVNSISAMDEYYTLEAEKILIEFVKNGGKVVFPAIDGAGKSAIGAGIAAKSSGDFGKQAQDYATKLYQKLRKTMPRTPNNPQQAMQVYNTNMNRLQNEYIQRHPQTMPQPLIKPIQTLNDVKNINNTLKRDGGEHEVTTPFAPNVNKNNTTEQFKQQDSINAETQPRMYALKDDSTTIPTHNLNGNTL